uniref:alpha-L-fucosidase n=1 Tax=Macrostomum lignano TaxID=282301 RepID=A0A1I8F3W0_9PLAT
IFRVFDMYRQFCLPLLLLLLLLLLRQAGPAAARYEPNWQSLDSRPLPGWYDQAKIGVFIHWGVFSVPGFGKRVVLVALGAVYRLLCGLSSRLWTLWRQTIRRDSPMPTLPGSSRCGACCLRGRAVQPGGVADTLSRSGAKYVVLTSKHHEGYCLWNTSHSFNWNSAQVGSGRNLLAELAAAIRNRSDGPRFGVYHSLYEWYNPLYLTDAQNNLLWRSCTNWSISTGLRSSGDGDAGIPEYWNSTSSWPGVQTTVQCATPCHQTTGGLRHACKHWRYFTCQDGYNPGKLVLQIRERYEPHQRKLGLLIPALLEERLLQLGDWLSINGEAVYNSTPWP